MAQVISIGKKKRIKERKETKLIAEKTKQTTKEIKQTNKKHVEGKESERSTTENHTTLVDVRVNQRSELNESNNAADLNGTEEQRHSNATPCCRSHRMRNRNVWKAKRRKRDRAANSRYPVEPWITRDTDELTARPGLQEAALRKLYNERATTLVEKYGQKFVPAPKMKVEWLQRANDDVIDETWRKMEWALKCIPDKATKYPYVRKGTEATFDDANVGAWLRSERAKTKEDCALRLKKKKNNYRGMTEATVEKIFIDSAKAHMLPMECDKNLGIVLVSAEQRDDMLLRELKGYDILCIKKGQITGGEIAEGMVEIITQLKRVVSALAYYKDKEAKDYIMHYLEKEEHINKLPSVRMMVKKHKLKLLTPTFNVSEMGRLPYRPIVPATGTVWYAAGKLVAEVLTVAVRCIPWVIQETADFTHWYANLGRDERSDLKAADATNLYGSIPPTAACMRLNWIVNNTPMLDEAKRRFPGMMHVTDDLPVGMRETLLGRDYTCMEALLYLILHNNRVMFEMGDGSVTLGRQRDGMAMGQPPVAPLANLLLASYEAESNGFDVCVRYVRRLIDDVAWVGYNVHTVYPEFVQFNNSNEDNEGYLTFLDSEVCTRKYDIRMHYKAFHMPFTDWASNVPRAFIANTVKTECIRAARICSNQRNYDNAVTYLRAKAAAANIPTEVIDSKMSCVRWSADNCATEPVWVNTLTQAERHIKQLHRQDEKRQQRIKRARKTLQKGTVVGIQTVYTGMDINIVQSIKRQLECEESLVSRAIVHEVDPYIAEAISTELKALTLVRARKPTPSIRSIARSTLATYIKGRRMYEMLEQSGAQWKHEGVCVRGVMKDFLEGVLPFHSTLQREITPPKAEEGRQKKAAERSTTEDGEGKLRGKRRRLAPV